MSVLFALQGILVAPRLGLTGACWVLGGTVALVVASVYVSSRSWTTVGAAGITICWGFGSGKTYSWDEIRWIDVRETGSQSGTTYAPRIFLQNGRRRSLPGLAHNALYPYPDFETDFQRVVNWWELSAGQEARTPPPKQLRDRVSPGVLGVVLGLVITVVVIAAVFAQG
ncbi:hypothetical protein E6W39_33600 [Kitasatospora acidiphila]|uniref:PH domain-containing protein n=1 Tax=Kitasatospora acidiphila TaxID=2567942 RepID=A0A540WB72_9ACTN|nr:hypothetical protein [Kitasatospora acidiphila]TQF06253.1 hypothetical protein E6W39_33600 [Kitasatospora acidiphila]